MRKRLWNNGLKLSLTQALHNFSSMCQHFRGRTNVQEEVLTNLCKHGGGLQKEI